MVTALAFPAGRLGGILFQEEPRKVKRLSQPFSLGKNTIHCVLGLLFNLYDFYCVFRSA